jgi:hypothetical protein
LRLWRYFIFVVQKKKNAINGANVEEYVQF